MLTIQNNEHGNIASSYAYFLSLNIDKEKRILDVGCSFGSLINGLHKLGYKNVNGLDIEKKYIKTGRRSYPDVASNMHQYNGQKIPYKSKCIDVVTMFDVIEHIPNIDKFIKKEVYRVLKDGGLFVFQTPNKYPNIIWQVINQRSITKWKTSDHCSLQTPHSLRSILSESGFKEIVIEKYNIITDHNKRKVAKKIGAIGIPMLYLLQRMPLSIYSNIWGYAQK